MGCRGGSRAAPTQGIGVRSGRMTRFMLNRYGRGFLSLRPLSLAHLRQAGMRGEGPGVVHLHSHMNLIWQAYLANFQQSWMSASPSGKGGSPSPLQKSVSPPLTGGGRGWVSLQVCAISQFHPRPDSPPSRGRGHVFSMLQEARPQPIYGTSPKTAASPGSASIQRIYGRDRLSSFHVGGLHRHTREFLVTRTERLTTAAQRGGIVTISKTPLLTAPVAGDAQVQGRKAESVRGISPDKVILQASGAHAPVLPGTAPVAAGSQTIVRQETPPPVGALQLPLLDKERIKGWSRRGTGGVAAPIIWAREGETSVQMVVRREVAATASAPDQPAQPAQTQTTVNAGQREAGRGMETATRSAVQAAQLKIDLNRLTDDVYRMLERRLITERERRGR